MARLEVRSLDEVMLFVCDKDWDFAFEVDCVLLYTGGKSQFLMKVYFDVADLLFNFDDWTFIFSKSISDVSKLVRCKHSNL